MLITLLEILNTPLLGKFTLTDIIAIIFTISIVVFVHELGHFIVARKNGVRVEKFSIGFGPEIFGWTRNNTRYAVSWILFGGYVKMAGEDIEEETQGLPDEFLSQNWVKKIYILVSGSLMNVLLAAVLFSFVLYVWGIQIPSKDAVIGSVIHNLPAEKAGLKNGDRILNINNIKIKDWFQMAGIIHKNPEKKLKIKIARDLKIFAIEITPKKDENTGKGLIGIKPKTTTLKFGLFKSIYKGFEHTFFLIILFIKSIFLMISGVIKPEIAGPVGIAQIISHSAKTGLQDLLYLIAVLSANIGFLNLFPIPVLDGGHIVLCLFEGVTKKKPTKKHLQIVNAIGISILITLLLFATYSDIVRWNTGFWEKLK